MAAQTAMLELDDEVVHRSGSSKSSGDNSSPKIETLGLQRQLIHETQELTIRFNAAFYSLRKAFAEVGFLRDENLKLRTENLGLSTMVAEKESDLISSASTDLASRLSFQPKRNERGVSVDPDQSSSDENKLLLDVNKNVPKVISVRSSGFLGMNKGRLTAASKSKNVCKFRANRPLRLKLASQGSGECGEVELEVYNQGMLKTELCNKWEEAGNCPYADRCQFAHGIEELRPVIRHPRYKTEICRMISSGGTCPYGHRCHFRHSLDPQAEKELVI